MAGEGDGIAWVDIDVDGDVDVYRTRSSMTLFLEGSLFDSNAPQWISIPLDNTELVAFLATTRVAGLAGGLLSESVSPLTVLDALAEQVEGSRELEGGMPRIDVLRSDSGVVEEVFVDYTDTHVDAETQTGLPRTVRYARGSAEREVEVPTAVESILSLPASVIAQDLEAPIGCGADPFPERTECVVTEAQRYSVAEWIESRGEVIDQTRLLCS
jgi:hypothetical protein